MLKESKGSKDHSEQMAIWHNLEAVERRKPSFKKISNIFSQDHKQPTK